MIRPGSASFIAVLDEIRDLHLRKTLDYGSDADALANIRSGADLLGIPAWQACLIRVADKMTRLGNVIRSGRCEFDGVPDTLLDGAAYLAISLVLYRESTDGPDKSGD